MLSINNEVERERKSAREHNIHSQEKYLYSSKPGFVEHESQLDCALEEQSVSVSVQKNVTVPFIEFVLIQYL